MNEKYIQVLTTTEKKEDLENIATIIVEKRLAACVKIFGPIFSRYWWKDKVETSNEWICFIKTKKELFHEVEETIKKNHPYETPEIIAIPIIDVSENYLEWLRNNLRNSK